MSQLRKSVASWPAPPFARRPSLLMRIELPLDIDLLSYLDCVVDLDAKVSYGAFDL